MWSTHTRPTQVTWLSCDLLSPALVLSSIAGVLPDLPGPRQEGQGRSDVFQHGLPESGGWSLSRRWSVERLPHISGSVMPILCVQLYYELYYASNAFLASEREQLNFSHIFRMTYQWQISKRSPIAVNRCTCRYTVLPHYIRPSIFPLSFDFCSRHFSLLFHRSFSLSHSLGTRKLNTSSLFLAIFTPSLFFVVWSPFCTLSLH